MALIFLKLTHTIALGTAQSAVCKLEVNMCPDNQIQFYSEVNIDNKALTIILDEEINCIFIILM